MARSVVGAAPSAGRHPVYGSQTSIPLLSTVLSFLRETRGPCRPPFDIIHVHAVPNFLPSLRASAPRAKIVFHAHDHRLARYEISMTRKLLASADSILACSQFVADAIAARFPTLAARCEHLYNGVDDRFF
ncbi:MAG: glycosyltransferase, partial [Desulfosarcina sp.]|nr:glycosyltransferase [Desulfobacterales bacterium]